MPDFQEMPINERILIRVRADLEARYGYDTKHAMHLCRLLRMGQEILTTGVVKVKRPDAEWLKGIRKGSMTYREVVEWSTIQESSLPRLVQESVLPEEPDTAKAGELLIELHSAFLSTGCV